MSISYTQLRFAAYQLKKNNVIAHPTDTIYGLSALPNLEAASRLLILKQRSVAKGLILLTSDIKFIRSYIKPLSKNEMAQITQTKKPTTFLVAKNLKTPYYICGEFDTVAIRVSQNKIIRYLCKQTNSALLSSSANISGNILSKSGVKCRLYFNNKLGAVILPNRPNDENRPSTIKHLKTQQIYR